MSHVTCHMPHVSCRALPVMPPIQALQCTRGRARRACCVCGWCLCREFNGAMVTRFVAGRRRGSSLSLSASTSQGACLRSMVASPSDKKAGALAESTPQLTAQVARCRQSQDDSLSRDSWSRACGWSPRLHATESPPILLSPFESCKSTSLNPQARTTKSLPDPPSFFPTPRRRVVREPLRKVLPAKTFSS